MATKKIPAIVKRIQNVSMQEINYKYQNTISYSQISTYYQCPYKWYLNYIKKIGKFEHNIHSTFGTTMHVTLQEYLTKMYNESKVKADEMNITEVFKEHLKKVYLENYKQNEKVHFSSAEELNEFFEDGRKILEFFVKKSSQYFSKRGWYLVGTEIPLKMCINPKYSNIIYTGLVDLIMYHEPTNTFKLYDFKTSSYSWGDSKKKDEHKQFQLILYKYLFSQLFSVDPKNIEVEFFILKRKLYEKSDFTQSRIQIFSPPSGKVKIGRALKMVNDFIEKCFNIDGSYKENITYLKDLTSCKWCTFNTDNKEHCDKKNIITK